MPRSALVLKALVVLAATVLMAVIWLAARQWRNEMPSPAASRNSVLRELVSSVSPAELDASNWDSPAARFERVLTGNTSSFDQSRPGAAAELRKLFLRNIAQAILQAECTPVAYRNSVVAFSAGVPFSMPSDYFHGYERLNRLALAALRVQGEDGVRSFGPLLFARQLHFWSEDVVFGSIADHAVGALEAVKHPDRLPYPQEVLRLGPEQWYAALRVWWLKKATANGWEEELRVVQRMMEERSIQPDGTGGYLQKVKGEVSR